MPAEIVAFARRRKNAAEEYRRHAQEAFAGAVAVRDLRAKETFLKAFRYWDALATEAAKARDADARDRLRPN